MLFDINNNSVFKEYLNLDKNKISVLAPKEGLILGNMFYETYDQYKNYKPREIVAKTEQDKLLLKIRELSFAVNDLNLYLDINPSDYEIYYLFKIYAEELNHCTKKYSEEYEVLELNNDIKDKYTWYKGPWPWEGNKYV